MQETTFNIDYVVVGPIEVNCYLLQDRATKESVLIDPGDDFSDIVRMVEKHHARIKLIIITHGHFDHIGAADELRQKYSCPLAIGELDAGKMVDDRKNVSAFMGVSIVCKKADRLLRDGELIEFGNSKLQVILTPGHTEGGICLYDGRTALFSGDTLFAGSVGRTDFPGGSDQAMITSVNEALKIVSNDAKVFPGHGPTTYMGEERATNPYFKF